MSRPRLAPERFDVGQRKVVAERQERERDELQMLERERDADDGDREDECRARVSDRDLPAEQKYPNHVEDDAKRAVGVLELHDLLAEGRQSRDADLHRLDAEREADDGDADQ